MGEGTSFHIYLPALPERQPGEAEPVQEPPGGHETVLIVEDDAAVRKMTGACLKKLGYRVIEAANATQAMKSWPREGARVDLLFSDIVMPGGTSGTDLAGMLRQGNPGLKVILAHGCSRETVDTAAIGRKRIHFLAKPFGLASLAKAVRNCLDDDQA